MLRQKEAPSKGNNEGITIYGDKRKPWILSTASLLKEDRITLAKLR
jgi:hypothetical protein